MSTCARASSPSTASYGLTNEQIVKFNEDGYLIIPAALSPSTITSCVEETRSLLENFSLADHPMTKFSTGDKAEHVGDDYFLTSGDKIRFFFEEDAFDTHGHLTKAPSLAINKIGHNLHSLSIPFAALLRHQGMHSPRAIARSLGFLEPRCLQSMVICKQPEIGGAVHAHQDSTFLYTEPPSALGFWYALEDATVENGCLSFRPGSHRKVGVERRLVRRREGCGVEMVNNLGCRFPVGDMYGGPKEGHREGEEDEDYVMAEVKAGDLVLIHGNTMHKSHKNLSSKGRIIYTFHIIEGQAKYDERNWLQPPKEGFTKL